MGFPGNLGATIMEMSRIDIFGGTHLAGAADFDPALSHCLMAAAGGDSDACYDLGIAFSTGSRGAECDLIEAHKWFNLAAAQGHVEASRCRADISDEMTAREIAEAQRRARQWLAAGERRVA